MSWSRELPRLSRASFRVDDEATRVPTRTTTPRPDSGPCIAAGYTGFCEAGRQDQPFLRRRDPMSRLLALPNSERLKDFKWFTGLRELGRCRCAHAIRV